MQKTKSNSLVDSLLLSSKENEMKRIPVNYVVSIKDEHLSEFIYWWLYYYKPCSFTFMKPKTECLTAILVTIGYEVIEQAPLRKCWKGRDGKITQIELNYFTGITGRTNQEARDAALIAWNFAGFPIRIKTK